MVTWHKMFSREVRLRESMKRIIAVMWQNDVAPAATGYTANDIILGIESGTTDTLTCRHIQPCLHVIRRTYRHTHTHPESRWTL